MNLSAAEIRELHDVRRTLSEFQAEWELLKVAFALKAYNPNQPRVPAGNGDESGQWTKEEGGWTRVANNTRGPGGGGNYAVRFQGGGPARFPGATLRQQVELESATLLARMAIAKVRERDPTWNPKPHIYQTIDGAIRARNAEVREAKERLLDMLFQAATQKRPGSESIPAEGPGPLNAREQRGINQLGAKDGCSTCGTSNPGTRSGNWIGDHQLPNALNPPGREQRIFPHCLACSNSQGGIVQHIRRLLEGK